MHKPLSESLQKLRRAQRALVRRKRRSRVRVSFNHPNASQSSGNKLGAAKRNSRQLSPDHVDGTPHALPHTPQETDIREIRDSAKWEDHGPYPPFARRDASSTQEPAGYCLGSPAKRRGVPPGSGLEGKRQGFAQQPPGKPPYWGALPKSPERSPPKPDVPSEPVRSGDGEERIGVSDQARQPSVRRQPHPAAPGTVRYSIFPKPPYQQKTPTKNRKPLPRDPSHESVRRSLSQQSRLTSLVPPENPPTAPTAALPPQEPPESPLPPIPKPRNARRTRKNIPSRSSSRQMALDMFTRELEQFAITTGAVGKFPVSTPTPTPTESHVSVHTVQEFLPYRQQFLDAGLAVTSTDQVAPVKRVQHPRADNSASGDDRLRFDGRSSSAQGSSSGSAQVSSSDGTTIRFINENIPISLGVLDEVPPRNWKARKGNVNLQSQSTGVLSASTVPWDVRVAQQSVLGPRPSTVHETNKPLPAKPMEPTSHGTSPGTAEGSANSTNPFGTQRAGSPPLVEAEGEKATSRSPTEQHQTKRTTQVKTPDKNLPSFPAPRSNSQSRHGIVMPSKSSWAPVVRPLPTTIVEEKEPSPEKHNTPTNRHCAIHHKSTTVAEIQNTKSIITQETTAVSRSSVTCKPELPETWKNAISTPSSFERALDDVVRKLEDMGENKNTAEPENPRPRSRRLSAKAPSPSQRLQRVAAMRRQRMAEAALHDPRGADSDEEPTVKVVTIPPQKSTNRPESGNRESRNRASSNRKAVKFPSGLEMAVCHEDREISDRDVLKGLKIICAASADPDLDSWIRSKTGLRLRRFLADLKTFEGLSQDGIAAVDHQRARRRRAERRRVQAERDSRMRRSLNMQQG